MQKLTNQAIVVVHFPVLIFHRIRGVGILHGRNSVAEHDEQLSEWNHDLQDRQSLEPVQRLLLNVRSGIDEALCHKVVHLFGIEAQRAHVGVQNFTKSEIIMK